MRIFHKIVLLILVTLSCNDSSTKSNMMIIGHRGAMGHETENSIASIEKALQLEVDMIEIDVFKIKSGEIVVFHDDEVDRLTDGHGPIEEFTWEALNRLNLIGGHKIPTLKDILEVIQHKVPLNIELKGKGTALPVLEIIDSYIQDKNWSLDDFFISSFDWEELKTVRKKNPDIAIGVLSENDPLDAISVAEQLNALSINPNSRKIDSNTVNKLHEAGFRVYVWTVNEYEEIERMRDLKVDGIFTNFPERAK